MCGLVDYRLHWIPYPLDTTANPTKGHKMNQFQDMENCPHCWAYYTKGYNHQCPPFMVALVKYHESKKNTIEPDPKDTK